MWEFPKGVPWVQNFSVSMCNSLCSLTLTIFQCGSWACGIGDSPDTLGLVGKN